MGLLPLIFPASAPNVTQSRCRRRCCNEASHSKTRPSSNEQSPNTHRAPAPPVVDVTGLPLPVVTLLTVVSPPLVTVAPSVPDVSVAVSVAFGAPVPLLPPPPLPPPPLPPPTLPPRPSVVDVAPLVVVLEPPPEPPVSFELLVLVGSSVLVSSSLTCAVDVQANAVAITRTEHQTLPTRFRGLRTARMLLSTPKLRAIVPEQLRLASAC